MNGYLYCFGPFFFSFHKLGDGLYIIHAFYILKRWYIGALRLHFFIFSFFSFFSFFFTLTRFLVHPKHAHYYIEMQPAPSAQKRLCARGKGWSCFDTPVGT